jgi:rare lipoprotein A
MLALAVFLGGCSLTRSKPAVEPVRGATQEGVASWYGPGFHGNATSSGEIYDQFDLTAAHRTLPLGTRVEVTQLATGRTVEVRINDRGPFVDDRIIDLSYAAAKQLGLVGPGTGRVRLEVLGAGGGGGPLPSARYAVQVGSFADQSNAERLRQQLAPHFEAVYVSTLESSAGRYYRVRLGRFAARDVAVDRAREAVRLGLPATVVEE